MFAGFQSNPAEIQPDVVTRGAVFSGGKSKIARQSAALEPADSTQKSDSQRAALTIPEHIRSCSLRLSPTYSGLRSVV